MEDDHIAKLREYSVYLDDRILIARKLMSSQFNSFQVEEVHRARLLAYTSARKELYSRFPELREDMQSRVPEIVSEDENP